MFQAPGKERAYAYVLLLKGDEPRKALASYQGNSSVIGRVGHSRGFVDIAGSKVTFEYTVQIAPAVKQAPQETLSVNGKVLDLGDGRVVLVDLSEKGPKWKQVRIDLPATPSSPTSTDQVEGQAKAVLDHLRRESKDVRAFLK